MESISLCLLYRKALSLGLCSIVLAFSFAGCEDEPIEEEPIVHELTQFAGSYVGYRYAYATSIGNPNSTVFNGTDTLNVFVAGDSMLKLIGYFTFKVMPDSTFHASAGSTSYIEGRLSFPDSLIFYSRIGGMGSGTYTFFHGKRID